MHESIIEFKIKGYSIKVGVDAVSIFDKDELLIKANYQQIKAVSKWLILKVNELISSSEIKSIEE